MGKLETLTGVTFSNGSLPLLAAVTPSGLFGSALKLWLSADKNVTLSGSSVATIADQSSLGTVFSGGSGPLPTFVGNAQNGQPGVANDQVTMYNIGQGLQSPAAVSALQFEYNQPFSVGVAFVARAATIGAGQLLGSNDTSFVGWWVDGLFAGSIANGLCFRLVHSINSVELQAKGPAMVAGTAYSYVISYDGSGTQAGIKFYLNGAPIAVTTSGLYNNLGTTSIISAGQTVNTNGGGTGYGSPHTLLEAYVVNRVVTPTEVATMDIYSNLRYAIH